MYVVPLIVKFAGVVAVPFVAAVTSESLVPAGNLTNAKFTVAPSLPLFATVIL